MPTTTLVRQHHSELDKTGERPQGKKSRVEVQDQKIQHIDPRDLALVSARLQFFNPKNDPIFDTRVSVYGETTKVFETHTNLDGEATIQFLMDVRTQVMKVLSFNFPELVVGDTEHVFYLMDNSNEVTQGQVDDILLRQSFIEDQRLLFEQVNNPNLSIAFKEFYLKYERKVNPTFIEGVYNELNELITKQHELYEQQKLQRIREQRVKKINDTPDYSSKYVASEGPFKGMRIEPWRNERAIYDKENNASFFLIDRKGNRKSTDLNMIEPYGEGKWKVEYQGCDYLIDNEGVFYYNMEGGNSRVGSSFTTKDRYGFIVPY